MSGTSALIQSTSSINNQEKFNNFCRLPPAAEIAMSSTYLTNTITPVNFLCALGFIFRVYVLCKPTFDNVNEMMSQGILQNLRNKYAKF